MSTNWETLFTALNLWSCHTGSFCHYPSMEFFVYWLIYDGQKVVVKKNPSSPHLTAEGNRENVKILGINFLYFQKSGKRAKWYFSLVIWSEGWLSSMQSRLRYTESLVFFSVFFSWFEILFIWSKELFKWKIKRRKKCIGENVVMHIQLKLGWWFFYIIEKTDRNGGFEQMFLATFTHL